MRHVIPISGKDSLATAIIQKQISPDIDYEYIFNQTGKELPETLDWISRVEKYLGKEIIFVGTDMKKTSEWIGGFRPSTNARWCTRKCKIEPTENYFNSEATVYYGLRADEPERIGYVNKGKSEMKAVYPLRTVGYGISEVLHLVNSVGLKPPSFFWELLYKEYNRRLGNDFISSLTEWQIDQLFAGRSRNNCYDCFNMRRYEWIWLHDTHPDIFWSVVEDEEYLGIRGKEFNVIKGYPLRSVIANRAEILERHISKTVRLLLKSKQGDLFSTDDVFNDVLGMTSCGLLCGK